MAKFNLPDIAFVEKDPLLIEEELIKTYGETAGVFLAEGDPRKKLLQSQVPIISGQRVNIDYSAKQNLLAYATGEYLDHIGILVGARRLPAAAAKTTERFTLSSIRSKPVTIPLGTRVTAGDGIFFSTLQEAIIPAGQSYVDAQMECTEAGAKGNNYSLGDLNTLVDPIPYVAAVSNITVPEGGADLEDDESFRERIQQAPESFSTAGPTGAYEYWAKTASVLIQDVSVSSPSPGVVDIRVLLENGEIPGQEILDAVYAICNDEKIRPLTDYVQVQAPEVVNYDLDVTYYIGKENASIAASLREKIEAAIMDYRIWQRTVLGRDINPSELIYQAIKAGAKRVVVPTPTYQLLEPYQVAKEQTVTVTYGGLEDG